MQNPYTFESEKQTREARCYGRLNLLRNGIPEPEEVNQQYKKVIYLAHPDRGGSHEECTLLNQAKQVLLDTISRKNYKSALVEFKLNDGLATDPFFDARNEELKAQRQE